VAEVKYYPRLYQDLDSFQGKLEAENERLKGELALGATAQPVEASAELDERLRELELMAERLGGASGDVTVLSVQGGYGLRLKDSILFDLGSTEVSAAGQELLVRMAGEIAAKPYQRIWVRGHSDDVPVVKPETSARFPHGNIQLSAARAIEVGMLLVSKGGIDEGRLVVAGFGPNDPVVPNASAENRQRNRRVEIFVIEDEAAAAGK
jgi:chemotaxis protein MotB